MKYDVKSITVLFSPFLGWQQEKQIMLVVTSPLNVISPNIYLPMQFSFQNRSLFVQKYPDTISNQHIQILIYIIEI